MKVLLYLIGYIVYGVAQKVGEEEMSKRFGKYVARKMKNAKFEPLVEDEIAALQVGTQIAKLRQGAGLTQAELAALAGMSAPKISDIERSAKKVTFATIVRIANALGSTVDVNFRDRKSIRTGAKGAYKVGKRRTAAA
jgi:DNA-binding XRE family transcriptional regulator